MAHNASLPKLQMAIDPADRPRYSREQLEKYFERIALPQIYLDSPVLRDANLANTREHGLPLLSALTRYHTSNIPFENLELHYSAHKTISLDMDDLYVKFVESGLKYGRGGRCMENNGFFGTVLRSLGFDVRNAGGRVSRALNPDPVARERQGTTYEGWSHMLNLVRIDESLHVVDVGMGAMGPLIPYELKDGLEIVSVAPRKIRLQKRNIPEHSAGAPKLWCYDVCHHPASPSSSSESDKWIPTYCFTETEFLPQDYEMMSWFTSTSPKSFFTYSVLCSKTLLSASGDEIIGDRSLFGTSVRQTVSGGRKVVRECASEDERVEVLRELFGVELTEDEREGIADGVKVGK